MKGLETYISDLQRESGAVVDETAHYDKLKALLNAVGGTLNQKVACVVHPRSQGAGIPDLALYADSELPREGLPAGEIWPSPTHGVVEAKGMAENVADIAGSEQVQKYLNKYKQVLVTNLYAFAFVLPGPDGKAAIRETYTLAESEKDFRAKSKNPRKLAETHWEKLADFLSRVMMQAAPLTTPEDVAQMLALYARAAKARIEQATDLTALERVKRALEEALGMKFEPKDKKKKAEGEHFFRSTIVQTLFYGLFSAWALWARRQTSQTASFDWRISAFYLNVPAVRLLFYQLAEPGQLDVLGLSEVLEWAGTALNRVDRRAFFERFAVEHAVQYFYEPFLKAFDPKLREQFGVWYTPPEIVQYMVARVDMVLREELNIPGGLADDSVVVLDPACGTGAYLVEVLRHIKNTLEAEGVGAVEARVKKAALERVFGFEILPAPFVVAHLQMGLALQGLGVPLADAKERARVYLTNALTGWAEKDENGEAKQLMLDFPELAQEREAATEVKQHGKILVVIGNPPYNAFAGTSPKEEKGLVESYKDGLREKWGIKKFNLDDLYIRFFRVAERCIADLTGKGVVCYISNFSYLSDPSFVVMREHFLERFDGLWFDCLNGDSRETGKRTPDGKPDPSVFSTEFNREGIQTGTAIGLMVRKDQHEGTPTTRFRHLWGVSKRADLLESLKTPDFDRQYNVVAPAADSRYSLRALNVSDEYRSWPLLPELCAIPPMNGLMEKRGGALIDIDRKALEKRMQMYYDPKVSWEDLADLDTGLTKNAAGFDAKKVRPKVQKAEPYRRDRVARYAVRPFDVRWCCYTGISPLWNRSRPTLWAQSWEGNKFLITRTGAAKQPEGSPVCFTACLSDNHLLSPHSVAIPFQLKNGVRLEKHEQATLFDVLGEAPGEDLPVANLSKSARAYLAALGINDPDADVQSAGMIWAHMLAIGYSPAYLNENADGIRNDWPRIPLPASRERLEASAELGRQAAALLDTETAVPGVTRPPRPALAKIGRLTHIAAKPVNENEGHLSLTASWGYLDSRGATMPGQGKVVEREYAAEERAAIAVESESALERLGETTRDIFLNDEVCWSNVPANVWEYTIGGYQVIKKWLSYREKAVLGRSLTLAEADEVTHIARRIAALLLLETQLDANYRAVKAAVRAWQGYRINWRGAID